MQPDELLTDRIEHLTGYSEAVFSADRAYRYLLVRHWGDPAGLVAVFLLLNPSTANHLNNDPTAARCIRFACREGASGMAILNPFALKATDPGELVRATDPVGPRNDEFIADYCTHGRLPGTESGIKVIAGWGANVSHPKLRARVHEVEDMLTAASVPVWCLGVTREGHPKHPLYLPATTPLEPYPAAARAAATAADDAASTGKDATVGIPVTTA